MSVFFSKKTQQGVYAAEEVKAKTQPDIQTLSMLASTLEVSEEDLIYGPSDSEKKTLTKIKENTTVEKRWLSRPGVYYLLCNKVRNVI